MTIVMILVIVRSFIVLRMLLCIKAFVVSPHHHHQQQQLRPSVIKSGVEVLHRLGRSAFRWEKYHSEATIVVTNSHLRISPNDGESVHQQDSQLYLPSESSQHQQQHPFTAVMAPMVSASDYAFRCLVRQYAISEGTQSSVTSSSSSSSSSSNHVPLTFTQMLHAHNLNRDETFFRHHFDIFEYSDDIDAIQRKLTVSQRNIYNDQNYPTIDRQYEAPCNLATRGPVIAQLAGHDVATVVAAAQKIVAATNGGIAGIDLNLGCPQNIARKGNYGAYLMENHPSTACRVLKALRDTLPSTVTVSAKIRLPYHPAQQKIRLEQLCDTGINFITVHGRDYTENKTTVKHIQLPRLIEAVQTIREYSRNKIPVIVNGGIEFVADAIQIQQQTGAAAVMSSEALLERPNLLGAIQVHQQALLLEKHSTASSFSNDMITTPRQQFQKQMQFVLDYLQWCYYVPPLSSGLGTKGGSFNVIRGHLFKMLYRYLNDPMNYDLRDQLGNGYSVQRLDQAEILVQTLRQRYESFAETDWDSMQSSSFPESSWYRRHRSASVLIHERIKPNKEEDMNNINTDASLPQRPTGNNTISVDERKIMIRKKIELLRDQKRKSSIPGPKYSSLL